nr:immunoglobulin heavy chain junction region [Mus musculus]
CARGGLYYDLDYW